MHMMNILDFNLGDKKKGGGKGRYIKENPLNHVIQSEAEKPPNVHTSTRRVPGHSAHPHFPSSLIIL